MAAPGDENIGGLDVAMDDALPVGGVEGVGDFDGERNEPVDFEGTAGNLVLEGDAVKVFHGDETLIAEFSDFIDGADVGMVQRGGGAGFAAKALEGLRIA